MRSLNLPTQLYRVLFIILCSGIMAQTTSAAEPKSIRIDQVQLARLGPADQARVLAIADRLETITSLDRSVLTAEERKCLREETRELKRQANTFNRDGTVIYISAGTLIIILLIILILT